eukprot:COSAG06_NODE_129_length_22602_cov_7.116318_10_plen_75_part_00
MLEQLGGDGGASLHSLGECEEKASQCKLGELRRRLKKLKKQRHEGEVPGLVESYRKTRLFLSFPYVCPEPVLVK